MGAIGTSLSTFPAFLAYLAEALALTFLFVAIYARLTPYAEIRLIREGNVAAATATTGALLGFIIPLAAVISQSANLTDVSIWGAVALAVQILGFLVCRLVFRDLPDAIAKGRLAEAIFLAGLSLGLGLLVAACMMG